MSVVGYKILIDLFSKGHTPHPHIPAKSALRMSNKHETIHTYQYLLVITLLYYFSFRGFNSVVDNT
jgi:hypothetical protein